MTDAQLEESLKGLGQEVTEENKQALRKRMEEIQKSVQLVKIKGTMTEHHTIIETPELNDEALEFKVPEGAVFKESLFGSFLGAKPPESPEKPSKTKPAE